MMEIALTKRRRGMPSMYTEPWFEEEHEDWYCNLCGAKWSRRAMRTQKMEVALIRRAGGYAQNLYCLYFTLGLENSPFNHTL